MSIAYAVLASGSKGNATWVRAGGTTLLVDCGISLRALRARLDELGEGIDGLDAVVCTHLHGDHLRGIPALLRAQGGRVRTGLPLRVLASAETLQALDGEVDPELCQTIPREGRLRVGAALLQTVPTLHDAPGSLAVRIEAGGAALGIVTDLGLATDGLARAFEGLDGLVLEMNHDPTMLETGPYPRALVRRIRSELGHLSNADGAALLARLHHRGLRHVTLAHLSEQNNRPALALEAARSVLPHGAHTEIVVAEPRRCGARVWLGPARGAQLGLPLDVIEGQA